jgi:hypothetical protein
VTREFPTFDFGGKNPIGFGLMNYHSSSSLRNDLPRWVIKIANQSKIFMRKSTYLQF